MTQYDKIKNICYYTFVSGYILFVFFYFFNKPIIGDYWNIDWALVNLYEVPTFWTHHAGRNFGELLLILPRAISSWLSIIPEPIYRFKFIESLTCTLSIVSLAAISSYIVGKNRKISFFVFSFYFFYTNFTRTDMSIIAVLPMLYVSLLPMIFYLRDHTLPSWMKDNPYKTFGYWAVFCYMGSNIYDPTYFLGVTFCGMILLYLMGLYWIPNIYEQKIKDKTSFYLTGAIAIFYILLSMFAALKNTSGRIGNYKNSISFNILVILNRLQSQEWSLEIPIIISILISIGIFLYFIKNKKISGTGYVYVALTAGSVCSLILIAIIGSMHTTYILWSSLIVTVSLVSYLWSNVKWTQIFIPTVILVLFMNVLLTLYRVPLSNNYNYGSASQIRVNTLDVELAYLFKKAQAENATHVFMSMEDSIYFNLDIRSNDGNEWITGQLSKTMYVLGYTRTVIPVMVTNFDK